MFLLPDSRELSHPILISFPLHLLLLASHQVNPLIQQTARSLSINEHPNSFYMYLLFQHWNSFQCSTLKCKTTICTENLFRYTSQQLNGSPKVLLAIWILAVNQSWQYLPIPPVFANTCEDAWYNLDKPPSCSAHPLLTTMADTSPWTTHAIAFHVTNLPLHLTYPADEYQL
jgi:hypothetical protein